MCVGFVVAKKMLCLLCFRVVCRACRSINSMSGWQSYRWRPTAELEQLRVEARSRGVEWLLTAVDALKWVQVDAMMFKNVSTHRKVSSNQMQVPKML